MNKQEFKKEWGEFIPIGGIDEFMTDLDSVIEQAIADHEAGKWKHYPEVIPISNKDYLVQTEDGIYAFDEFRGITWFAWGECVIAFRELPAPYQETKQAKFPDTTSEPLPDAYQPKEGGKQ